MILQKQVKVRETQRRALARLRENIADIEKRDMRFDEGAFERGESPDAFISTGVSNLDDVLGGGLIRSALTEIYAEAARDAGALTGFVASILSLSTPNTDWSQKPVLWISTNSVFVENGALYGLGLKALGLDPARLLLTAPRRIDDALWICEEAAKTKGLGATVFDMRGYSAKLDLRETRRLHVRAQSAGHPVFLVRQSALPQTSAAPQRLIVKAAPSHNAEILGGTPLARLLPGSIGPPSFEITVDKNKNGPAGSRHILHWNAYERSFYTDTKRRTGCAPADRSTNQSARYEAQNENRRAANDGNTNAYFIA